jgi:hypothetical protein
VGKDRRRRRGRGVGLIAAPAAPRRRLWRCRCRLLAFSRSKDAERAVLSARDCRRSTIARSGWRRPWQDRR